MYYAVLSENRSFCYNCSGCYKCGEKWNLPTNKPGKWMPEITNLTISPHPVAYEKGYIVYRHKDLMWQLGPTIWEVETRGKQVEREHDVVAAQGRLIRKLNWNKLTALTFACDCAEHVLPIFEQKFPNDKRPREAMLLARTSKDKHTLQQTENAMYKMADSMRIDATDLFGAKADVAVVCAAYAAISTAVIVVTNEYPMNTPVNTALWAASATLDTTTKLKRSRKVVEKLHHGGQILIEGTSFTATASYNTERQWQINKLKEVL